MASCPGRQPQPLHTPPAVQDIKEGRVQTVLSGPSLIALPIELWNTLSTATPLEGDWALAMTSYNRNAGPNSPPAASWRLCSGQPDLGLLGHRAGCIGSCPESHGARPDMDWAGCQAQGGRGDART